DQGGQVIAKSGKSTSPNQVLLEAGATPRFYPDWSDDETAAVTPTEVKHHDDEDDPLHGGHKRHEEIVVQPTEPGPPGTGFADVGSTKFTYAKWGTTAGAAVFLGFG